MPYNCNPRFARRSVAFTPFGGLEVLGGLISALEDNNGSGRPTRCAVPTANPHFDVYETKESYVLEGELPGVSDKKSINLEFTDAQTLSVRGSISRSPRGSESPKAEGPASSSPAAPAAAGRNEKADTEMSDATLDHDEALVEGLVRKESPAPSYRATVEDDVDVDDDKSDFEVVNTPRTNTPAPAPVPAGGPAADEKEKQQAEPTTAAAAAAAAAAVPTSAKEEDNNKEQRRRRCAGNGRRYWVSERSTGVFHRSFSFSGLVDQEAVKATLENGLLTVVVPKRKPYVARVNID